MSFRGFSPPPPMKLITAILILGVTAGSLSAGTIVRTAARDHAIAEGNPPTAVGDTATSIRVGANSAAPVGGRAAVFLFELPPLPQGASLAGATLSFQNLGKQGGTFNADLWGLGFQQNTNPSIAYFEADTGDAGHTKLQNNLLTPSTPDGTLVTTSVDAALGAYLQGFYDANPGYAGSGSYVALRLNPDADSGNGNSGWNVASKENSAGPAPKLTFTTAGGPPPPPPLSGPNFIFIITDDQRYDAMGVVQRELAAQGRQARFPFFADQTPSMDRLAAEGIRFRNAFVTYSLCSPSRASFLTGRYNHLNGVRDNKTPFPTSAVTYATLLRDAGYQTGYVGKWHMGDQAARPGFTWTATYKGQGQYFNQQFLVNGGSVGSNGWVDDVSTDYALQFIGNNAERPFLLVVGYKSPHEPRTPATRHKNLYASATPEPAINADDLPPYKNKASGVSTEDTRNYFRTLKGVDENLGRILTRLDELSLAENTVVVFVGDNGYYINDHGLRDKRSAYEESMRIPLLVRHPRLITTPRVRDELVLNIDLAPTFLELAGLTPPPAMQGRSWKPLMENAPVAWRPAFLFEYFVDPAYPDAHPDMFAVRTATEKLVIYPGHEEWTELFDLSADPYERNSLTTDPSGAALLQALRERFDLLMRETELILKPLSMSLQGSLFTLRLAGGAGPSYQFESTPDLQVWSPLRLIDITDGDETITDSNAGGGAKFYRGRMIQPALFGR